MSEVKDVKVRDFVKISTPETISEAAFRSLSKETRVEEDPKRGTLFGDFDVALNVQVVYRYSDMLEVKFAGRSLGTIGEQALLDGDTSRSLFKVRSKFGDKYFARLEEAVAYFMFSHVTSSIG